MGEITGENIKKAIFNYAYRDDVGYYSKKLNNSALYISMVALIVLLIVCAFVFGKKDKKSAVDFFKIAAKKGYDPAIKQLKKMFIFKY